MTEQYNNVFINDFYTIVGPKESKGKITYNDVINDYYFEEKTYEDAEVKMQKKVIDNILYKNKLLDTNIDLLLGGDLINQISVTNTTASNYNIPFLGLYSACATFNESILLASTYIESKIINKTLCITSSHNLTAERQYRYPVEYGPTRKLYSSHTATGSVGVLLSSTKSNIKVESSTIGKSVEYGITDANNMGAIMAPAAADTLFKHLKDLKRDISYYDIVLTGDLGEYGSIIFKEFLNKKYNIKLNNYIDASSNIYDEKEKVYAGGSGPVCLPLYLFGKILNEKKYKKVLLLATGSLHSTVLVNQHKPLCAITHAISLEVMK